MVSLSPLNPRDSSPTDEMVSVSDGVALHVRRWRSTAGGRPFLLVHGLSSNAHLWDEAAEILVAAGHDTAAIDLRSHGTSDAPATGYDTATAADDVAAVAAAFDISGGVLVGQSWGGDVAVQVAARHPGVAALGLIDGGWSEMSSSFPSWEACASALRPPDIDGTPAETLRGYFRTGHPDWSDRAIEATLANLAVAADGTVTRRLSIPHHMEIVRSMWDDPPTRHYPDVHVPVLLMPALAADGDAGRRDRVAKAAADLADATVREYVGADHDIHAQHPGDVAADLLALAARAG